MRDLIPTRLAAPFVVASSLEFFYTGRENTIILLIVMEIGNFYVDNFHVHSNRRSIIIREFN